MYDRFEFITPPRPASGVNTPPGTLPRFEAKGWWGQAKKNGTNNVVFVRPDRGLICMTRHGTEHRQWSGFTRESGGFYADLPGKGWCVFNEELLHSKSGGYRDTHFIHDVLVYEGEYLGHWTYADRYDLLTHLFQRHATAEATTHWLLNDRVWLAKVFESNLAGAHAALGEFDEGLMLKDPRATLSRASKGGLIRCLKQREMVA